MPAVNSIVARDVMNELSKRKNWAAREPGVMVVFCIVGVVAIFLVSLFGYKWIRARKAQKTTSQV